MASINIRIDYELKQRYVAKLEKLGVTPSQLLRQTLQYVADTRLLAFYRRQQLGTANLYSCVFYRSRP